MKTLLIEDDPSASELASYILRAAGHEVDLVNTAAEALRLDVGAYDMIVVDLGLPDVDGVEVIRKIRGAGRGTPILVCSAYAGDAHQREAREAGCDHFLAKPFRRQQLLDAMERARTASLGRA